MERTEGTGTPVSAAVNKCGPETRRDREVRNFSSYPGPGARSQGDVGRLASFPSLALAIAEAVSTSVLPPRVGPVKCLAVYDDNCCG